MRRALHRAVLRSRGVPGLGALYRGGYAGATALAAGALHALPGSRSVYLHRGLTREGWEPGVSDIDLIFLREEAADEAAALAALGARVSGLKRLCPMLGDLWIGSEAEARTYLRWGGLRAWEDSPDWRLLRGRALDLPASAESAAKRRWLDAWVWAFTAHMDISRRLFTPGPELAEKRDADLRKLFLDSRRCADFILEAKDGEAKPSSRAAARERHPGAGRLPARELWLDSALTLSRASRRALAATASEARGAAAFAEGDAALAALVQGPVRAAVRDVPYHTYLLLDEGAGRCDYEAAAELIRTRPVEGVPLVLEPASWALLLQSSYLGAPLGRLGGGGYAESSGAGAPFRGWGARAAGRLPDSLPLLPERLRWEAAAEAASWMLLWWRALWIAPGWSNRFVLQHLCTRAAGLRLTLDGDGAGPFSAWELQFAALAAKDEARGRGLARLRDGLLACSPAALDSTDRARIAPAAFNEVAALASGLRGAIERAG
jgi:hypothetical protein